MKIFNPSVGVVCTKGYKFTSPELTRRFITAMVDAELDFDTNDISEVDELFSGRLSSTQRAYFKGNVIRMRQACRTYKIDMYAIFVDACNARCEIASAMLIDTHRICDFYTAWLTAAFDGEVKTAAVAEAARSMGIYPECSEEELAFEEAIKKARATTGLKVTN